MPEIKDITTQEIDDFIIQNNLDPKEKFMFRILRNNYINSECSASHITDKELHTPKGLLVKPGVIAWGVFIMFLISTIVMYIPEGLALIKSIP